METAASAAGATDFSRVQQEAGSFEPAFFKPRDALEASICFPLEFYIIHIVDILCGCAHREAMGDPCRKSSGQIEDMGMAAVQ